MGGNDLFASGRWLGTARGLLVGISILAGAMTIWDLREDTIDESRDDILNLGVVLAEQTSRTIQAVDLVLQEVSEKVSAARIASPEQFKRVMATAEVHDYLLDRRDHLPQADAIVLLDADGMRLNYSRAWPIPRADLSDREYFPYLRDHDDASAIVSGPARNRTDGAWTIFLARRINGPHHEFLGVAVGAVGVRYFEEFYEAIAMRRDESVTLLRRDGVVLARFPDPGTMTGKVMPPQSPWFQLVGNGGGGYRSPGYFDGIVREVSVHPLHDYPLVVDVTVSEDEILAHWRRQSAFIAAGALCAVVGFVLLFRALGRQFDRLERQALALRRTADALRESNGRFRDFAEASSDWFWEQDAEFRFTSFSGAPPTKTYTGKRRWEMAPDGASAEEWAAHRADCEAHRPFRDFRYCALTSAGALAYWSISGQPIFGEDGAFVGYRGTGRDVTGEIAVERQRQELERQLHHSQRIEALGTLAGGIAHDINNTLVPVLALSKTMLKHATAGSVEASKLNIIFQAGLRARDLVKQILAFSRKETGVKRVLDIGLLIREMLPMMRAAVPSTIDIVCRIPDPLPLVFADSSQLHQVVINLVTNAAQAIGGRLGRIEIALDTVPALAGDAAPALRLAISDTGEGMDAQTMRRIFEPFFTTRGVNEGTGLGLAVVHGIVSGHGGTIAVSSELGVATRFEIRLPAAEAPRAEAAKPAKHEAAMDPA